MLSQPRVDRFVGVDETAHDFETGIARIMIFGPPDFAPIGDDSLDVPLARVQQKPNERLFVIGISARVGLDDQPQALAGGLLGTGRGLPCQRKAGRRDGR